MELRINGESRTIKSEPDSLLTYLQQYERIQPAEKGVAVALNGQVVPKTQWPTTPIRPGDTLEIVRAFQGG